MRHLTLISLASCPDVPSDILDPRETWEDVTAYDAQAKKLAHMFKENFEKKYPNMPEEIRKAGPRG